MDSNFLSNIMYEQYGPLQRNKFSKFYCLEKVFRTKFHFTIKKNKKVETLLRRTLAIIVGQFVGYPKSLESKSGLIYILKKQRESQGIFSSIIDYTAL
jgi:hypothetical protein